MQKNFYTDIIKVNINQKIPFDDPQATVCKKKNGNVNDDDDDDNDDIFKGASFYIELRSDTHFIQFYLFYYHVFRYWHWISHRTCA